MREDQLVAWVVQMHRFCQPGAPIVSDKFFLHCNAKTRKNTLAKLQAKGFTVKVIQDMGVVITK